MVRLTKLFPFASSHNHCVAQDKSSGATFSRDCHARTTKITEFGADFTGPPHPAVVAMWRAPERVRRAACSMLGLALIAGLSITFFSTEATAEPGCGERQDVLTKLADRYKETPIGFGLATTGVLIELLRSETQNTWSLIVTTPKGTSCILAAGEDWQAIKSMMISQPAS
jgi:hypothetical protein